MIQDDHLSLFLAVCESHPDHMAVSSGSQGVTYAALSESVHGLAQTIADVCKNPHPQVLIALPQGAFAYAAMLATTMAGGFYAPLNLDYPADRKTDVLRQFSPDVIIAEGKTDLEGVGIQEDTAIIFSDQIVGSTDFERRPPHRLAYVMFTSGSTGSPKGVSISREALLHYVRWCHRTMCISIQDRWSQHPNIAFDLSVLDIYGALCAGATLFPVTATADKLQPARFVEKHDLTIWNSVPSVVDLMSRTRQITTENLKSLRLMTFCGEPLLENHLDQIFEARPDIHVQNTYGPTEATVSMTEVVLEATNYQAFCDGSVTLGAPIEGMRILLEDGPSSDEGEVVIAGPQVADGYWGDPDRTSQVFVRRTIDGVCQPAYRTGDWAQFINGQLYFRSRIDRQVKRNGHRIELGDIDVALRKGGAINAASLMLRGKIISFVEVPPGSEPTVLFNAAKIMLPSFCLPDKLVRLNVLPRNANDKIDIKSLEAILNRVESLDQLPWEFAETLAAEESK